MTEPKSQTLQQRFGFSDPDLKTPDHDVIMQWLVEQVSSLGMRYCQPEGFDKRNADVLRAKAAKIIDGVIEHINRQIQYYCKEISILDNVKAQLNCGQIPDYFRYHQSISIEECKSAYDCGLQRTQRGLEQWSERLTVWQTWSGLGDIPVSAIKTKDIKWEFPVMNDKFMIGFIDLRVIYRYPNLLLGEHDIDRCVLPSWHVVYTDQPVYFECKTYISSIGELMRQINMYRQYIDDGPFVVVSPDDRWVDILRNQEVDFVKFTPAKTISEEK